MTVAVDRAQVLAYRVAAQGLAERGGARPSELAVLDLGVPDVPYGSARLALAARTSAPLDDDALTLLWAARGAPHLQRTADLEHLALALWPLSDADATARFATTNLKEGGALGLSAFTSAAEALRAVVVEPMTKGDVSTAVSARVPEVLTYWCRSCDAQHISGGLFQQVGLPGGVRLEPGSSPTTLAPLAGWPGVPDRAQDTASLIRAYLRLLGPATPSAVAGYLGTKPSEVRTVWPDDLTEVRVDGGRAWLPADRVDVLRAAEPAGSVRLIPPSDPYLQARDRDLLVPERDRQKAVWRVLGNPGALLVDGELAGTWRAKLGGKSRLAVSVTPFAALPSRTRKSAAAEAQLVAAARSAPDVQVTFED